MALLPDAERRLLVLGLDAAEVDYGRRSACTQMFETQVEKTPDAWPLPQKARA